MKITESLNTSQNVDLLDKQESSNEVTFENLENTPFTMVKQKGLWYGIIGNHRITEGFLNEKELEAELKEVNWNRLIQVIWAVVEKFKVNNEQFKTEE